MAGFLTPDEEQSLLYSQLSQPSMPTTDANALRDRIAGGVPAPDGGGLLARIAASPITGALMAGPGAPGAYLASKLAGGLSRGVEGSVAPSASAPFADAGGDAGVSAPVVRRDAAASAPSPMPSPLADVQPASPLGGIGARPAFGGVGMASSNPLAQAVADARSKQLQTLGQEQDLVRDTALAKSGAQESMSQLQQTEARRQMDDAAWQQAIDQSASTRMQSFLATNERIANEIGTMAPDPGRLMRNADVGQQVSMAIGAVAGGMLSALNGGPNQFLDRLDHLIDRDINAQNEAIANKKASLTARQGIFAQMLAETGDSRLAAQQTRQHILEAVKLDLQAKASSYAIPEIRANAEQAANAVQQKIDALDLTNKQTAYQQYLQQASAAAAAQRAAEERAFEHSMRIAELGIKGDQAGTERLKAQAEMAKNGLGANGLNLEDQQRLRSLQAGWNGVEDIVKQFKSSPPGSVSSKVVPGLGHIPGTDAQKYRQSIDDFNTRATLLLGPIVEAMNKGKPGAVELGKLQQEILIPNELTPTSEIVARAERLHKLQQDAAATLNQSLGGPGVPFTPRVTK